MTWMPEYNARCRENELREMEGRMMRMMRWCWYALVRWWWVRKLVRVGLPRADALAFVNAVLDGQIPVKDGKA